MVLSLSVCLYMYMYNMLDTLSQMATKANM